MNGFRSPFKQPKSPEVLHAGRGTSPNWWDAHNEAMKQQEGGLVEASAALGAEAASAKPGGQAYMAGAAWFGRSAVFINDSLGDDVESLRNDTMQRLKVNQPVSQSVSQSNMLNRGFICTRNRPINPFTHISINP